MQASLVLAFGLLAEPIAANLSQLQAILINAQSNSIRLAAAMALVRLTPERLPGEALATLVEAAQSPDAYKAMAQSVWARVDDIELIIINHLACLDAKSAVAAVDMLATILPNREHHQALTIAEVLLNIAFRETVRRGSAFAGLNEQQQRVLKLIVQNRNIWIEIIGHAETTSIKTSMLLRSCGLPEDQAGLASFVGAPEYQARAVPPQNEKPSLLGDLKKLFKRTPPS